MVHSRIDTSEIELDAALKLALLFTHSLSQSLSQSDTLGIYRRLSFSSALPFLTEYCSDVTPPAPSCPGCFNIYIINSPPELSAALSVSVSVCDGAACAPTPSRCVQAAPTALLTPHSDLIPVRGDWLRPAPNPTLISPFFSLCFKYTPTDPRLSFSTVPFRSVPFSSLLFSSLPSSPYCRRAGGRAGAGAQQTTARWQSVEFFSQPTAKQPNNTSTHPPSLPNYCVIFCGRHLATPTPTPTPTPTTQHTSLQLLAFGDYTNYLISSHLRVISTAEAGAPL